jgi:hypothetical protein
MAKKTIPVEFIKNQVNEFLRTSESPFSSVDYRQSQISLLTSILMETGNYSGFRYLGIDEVPVKEKPGIWKFSTQCVTTIDTDILFAPHKTDSTRVHFF